MPETDEQAFIDLLRTAISTGRRIQATGDEAPIGGPEPSQRTRENSVAITEAETALLWAEKDARQKGIQIR